MKKSVLCGLAFAIAALSAGPLAAQTQTPTSTPAVVIPADTFIAQQDDQQYLGKDRLIGANLYGKDGVVLGDIEDVILNTETNTVVGVLVGTGGVLGMAEKKVAVRYSALQFQVKESETTIALPTVTREMMASLPAYERTEKKSLMQKARDRVRGIFERTKQDAGPALEKAKEAGSAALEKSKELGKAAIEKGKEAIDAAKEKVSQPRQ